jgi:signal peptidase I
MAKNAVPAAARCHKWAGRLVLLALAALVAMAGVQVLSGRYQVHPVLTGSMRPGFSLGSVVVVKRVPMSSLAERDVIIFHKPTNPSEYVVHRITKMTRQGGAPVIETKGDDNPVADPWKFTPRGTTAYRAEFTIPFVGYAALWLHRPETRRYALFVGAALLLMAAASTLFRRDPMSPAADPEEGGEELPTCADHGADPRVDTDTVSEARSQDDHARDAAVFAQCSALGFLFAASAEAVQSPQSDVASQPELSSTVDHDAEMVRTSD